MRVRIERVRRRPTEVRTPGAPWPGVERLVVARDDRLGDVVVSLPAVRALRSAYPRAELALLVRPPLAPLGELVDGVDRVLAPQPGTAASALAGFRPDLMVCISRSARLAFAARRAGVRHTVGAGRRWWSFLFERRVVESRRRGARHEVEHALAFAHRAGAGAGPHEATLRLPAAATESVRAWRAASGLDRPYVLLHPGSGGSCPSWPLDHWARLASILDETGVPVALSFGPEDDRAARFFESTPARRFARVEPGLDALAATARDAAAVVGNSTGPVHVAALWGTPTVAIHAPWTSCAPERWGPYAENGWSITPVDPGVRWTRRRRRTLGAALLEAIEPELVARTVRDVVRTADARGTVNP